MATTYEAPTFRPPTASVVAFVVATYTAREVTPPSGGDPVGQYWPRGAGS